MRTLVKAIVANLSFYGNMLYEETIPILELAGVLDIEPESERFTEIQQLCDELRHDLGASNAKARRLLELLSYKSDD